LRKSGSGGVARSTVAKNSAERSAERGTAGHPFGIHRVLDAEARLPQAADHLDNSLPLYSNEILVAVERLNIDAASFVQMEQETGHDTAKIAAIVQENCRTRGKQQNRVTGSGGMLVGSVTQVGSAYRGPLRVSPGDRIASLVSLTLTPLHLEAVTHVDTRTHQLAVRGHAVLFESSIAAVLPSDIDETVAMAVFDVAGAPATVDAMCKKGQRVVVIGGGGKAGVLSCVAARQRIGPRGRLVAVEPGIKAAADLRALGVCDEVLEIDARDPIAVRAGVEKATNGKMGDVVINVASIPETEISSILAVRGKGQVLFFGMATSFSRVALGAEGIAATATLLIGNGYYPNHGKFAVELLRRHKRLRELFYRRYGTP
jgi:L-erythro-3,5-diaminohexanoate dehydrogenase